MAKVIALLALAASAATANGTFARRMSSDKMNAQMNAGKALIAKRFHNHPHLGRILEEEGSMADTCKMLTDLDAAMANMSGRRLQDQPTMPSEAYCDDLAGWTALSGNDGGASSCDLNAAYHDYLCNGMCSTECLASKSFAQSSNDEAAGGEEPDVSSVCKDECFPVMAEKLSVLINAMEACSDDENTGMSGNDEDEAGVRRQLDGTTGDDTGDSGSNDAASDSLNKLIDEMEFMCVENTKGENCIDMMKVMDQYEEPSEVDMTAVTCDQKEMVSLLTTGCCFATFMQQMAYEMEDATSAEKIRFENEFDAMEQFSFDFKKCGGTLIPCSDNAMSDAAVVESSITFDGADASIFEDPTKRKSIREAIAADVSKSGTKVSGPQVLLTGVATTRRGRDLADGLVISYQVTLPASKKAAVESKISAGIDTAAIKSAAPELSTATVTASTTTKTEVAKAVVPKVAPKDAAITSGCGKSRQSLAAAVGVLICTALLSAARH
jgi:hypothetical protein